jgi:hypothetical protein
MRGMSLGESINTFDPNEALHNEVGTFRIKVPADSELVLNRNPNGETSLRWSNPQGVKQQASPFLITKISEPAGAHQGVTSISKTG